MHRLLAVLVALAVGVAGHGGHINHTSPLEGTLDPGMQTTITLAFDDQPLQADWWWLLSGEVRGAGTLTATLSVAGARVDRWTWDAPADLRADGIARTRLPQTGFYELELWNPSSQPVSYRLFYDQTCDCSGKRMPFNGSLWFNIDAREGDTVDLKFEVFPQFRGGSYTEAPTSAQFTITHLDAPDGSGTSRTVPLSFDGSTIVDATYKAAGGTHYMLVTGVWDKPGWDLAVYPAWDVTPAEAPAPFLLAALLVALALVARR